jgi:hypothetical protein
MIFMFSFSIFLLIRARCELLQFFVDRAALARPTSVVNAASPGRDIVAFDAYEATMGTIVCSEKQPIARGKEDEQLDGKHVATAMTATGRLHSAHRLVHRASIRATRVVQSTGSGVNRTALVTPSTGDNRIAESVA